jgi:1,6-anhydro-N-acetylmuramate kinase
MFKTKIDEAAYVGNIGAMEMFKFYQKASEEQKRKLKTLIGDKKNKDAWKLVQDVTGVKLHKSVNESKQSPDILPVSGAGQDGTDTLRKKYQNNTPGQKVKSFTEYNRTK